MKRLVKLGTGLRLATMLLLFVVQTGCKKTDITSDTASVGLAPLKIENSTLKQSEESGDVIYQWYKFMTILQRRVTPQPLVFVATRAYAYIGIGLFESVQPGIKGGSSFGPKLYEMPAMPKPDNSKTYLWSASANAAMASMTKLLLASLSPPNKLAIDAKEAAIYNHLKLTTPEDVLQRSAEFGRSVATAIFDWSKTDNFSVTSGTYVPLNQPWAWAPTPPNFLLAIGDSLQYARPFLRFSLTATAPPIPVAYSENPSSEFFRSALEVYNSGGTLSASPANKATASWWADAGGVGVGLPAPYHVLSVVTSVLESRNASLWKAAEMYAKTGIAIKDGPRNTFRAKYQFNFIRPVTFIRRHINPSWSSHLITPPYPEYPSGLVSIYGPAMQVLINEYGTIPVTDNCYSWRGLPARQFSSLGNLIQEAAVSRVYGGIHYRFTQNVSVIMGVELGDEISKIRVIGPKIQ